MSPSRILVVTSGLARGGAESFLARLLPRLAARGYACAVVSLDGGGPLAPRLRESGIEVAEPKLGAIGARWRLPSIARAFRPDVVQGWMYRGNLAADVAARATKPRAVLVWSVRQGLADHDASPFTTRLAIRACARRSRRPSAIVYNAESAARQHAAFGFASGRARVVPNGIDPAAFARPPGTRERVRAALGVPDAAFVVALVARWHPVKDHRRFLRAASIFARRRPEARFLLAGAGVDASNATLGAWMRAGGLEGRCVLLGEREDVPDLLAAADLATLSSIGEAFPNALLEGMAAGLACVAPDVGDVAPMLGGTGVVVPPRDPEALAAGWESLAALPAAGRAEIGARARQRAAAVYGIEGAVDAFAGLYAELLRAEKTRL